MIVLSEGSEKFSSVLEALEAVMRLDNGIQRYRGGHVLDGDAERDAQRFRSDIRAILNSAHGACASLDRMERELPFASVPVAAMRAELCGEVA